MGYGTAVHAQAPSDCTCSEHSTCDRSEIAETWHQVDTSLKLRTSRGTGSDAFRHNMTSLLGRPVAVLGKFAELITHVLVKSGLAQS